MASQVLPIFPQWVVEFLVSDTLLVGLVDALKPSFQATKNGGDSLGTEARTGRILHSFLVHPTAISSPVPGFPWLILLVVNQELVVHLLNLLLSVPVVVYSFIRQLFSFGGYIK